MLTTLVHIYTNIYIYTRARIYILGFFLPPVWSAFWITKIFLSTVAAVYRTRDVIGGETYCDTYTREKEMRLFVFGAPISLLPSREFENCDYYCSRVRYGPARAVVITVGKTERSKSETTAEKWRFENFGSYCQLL